MMKRKQLLKPLFLLCALLVGGLNSVWGQTADVTYDFTESGWSVNNGTLSNGTVSFTGAGGKNFNMNTGYFILGKSGAYINFPIYSSPVSKIVVTGRSGASGSVKQNIYVGENAVSTKTTGATGTNTYEIASDYQAAGTQYTLKVTSDHNTQITKIEVFYASPASQVATPTFSPAAGAVTEGTEVTIKSTTEGATIYYTTDGSTPTTSSTQGTTVTINEACTVKAIAVKDGMDNSAVATAEYTIAQIIKGYTIDFESDLGLFVDWTFDGINNSYSNANVSAHGGSKYGSNTNSSNNGVTSGSVTTKTTIALPGTFTCYVSRASNNTTSSNWKVQVSSDGTTWTDVKTQSATSMDAGTWVEITASLDSYSNVYVRLYYDGSTAIRTVDDIELTMRDPNAKATPTVTINATGLTTDIAGGTDVAAGTLTATVASGETTITSPAVTWTSSNTAVATIDASTGAVTLKHVGTTTITAVFAGNDNYNEATATYELTVIDSHAKGGVNNPYTVAEARTAIDAGTGVTGVYVTGKVSEIVTAYNSQYGNISYNISADGTTTSDQLQAYRGKSYNGENFTSENDIKVGDVVVVYGDLINYNGTYEFAANNQLVSLQREKGPAVINVSDKEVAYGETYTLSLNDIEGGDVTVTSSNEDVATVDGLVITSVAVGTTTITVETEENEYYYAGSETFTLTVTAPVGKTTAAVNGFNKVTTTAGITDGDYLIVYEAGNVAFNGGLETLDAEKNTIAVEINDNTIAANEDTKKAIFTINKAAGTLLSKSGKYVYANSYSNRLDQSNNVPANTNSFSIDANKDAVIDVTIAGDKGGTVTMRYNSADGQTRFRYYKSGQQAIQLYKLEEAEITVTLNASGYASYCSEYPLDFTNAEANGYSAWQITAVNGSDITFEQITGSVKGGTGVLLKGEAGATITLTSVASETELTDNKLKGTLAPTNIAANEYYGLSGQKFVKIKAGTVKAGKAILPISAISASNGAPELNMIFSGEGTTGIRSIDNGQLTIDNVYYDLSGRRVAEPTKGVYIVNGKKVVIK